MSTGPFHCAASIPSASSTSHGRPARSLQRGRPATGRHAQVTAHGHASLEAEQKVLSDRLDGLEPAPVDHASHACGLPSRVRRAGGDAMADERLQPESGAVEGVAFGHLR